MTTKTYLQQIRRYKRMIENKSTEIFKLRQMACGLSIKPQEIRVQTSSEPDRIGSTVAKIVDLENEIDAVVKIYIEKRNVIIEQIENLGDDAESIENIDVLTCRFVNDMDFKHIPDAVSMSRRKMFYVYGRALDAFEKKYGKEYRKT